MELTWHPAHPSQPAPRDESPAARRDALIALVAALRPGIEVRADSERCRYLGGPWYAAIWPRGPRTLRAVCRPSGTTVSRSTIDACCSAELPRGADAAAAVLAGVAWLMEG